MNRLKDAASPYLQQHAHNPVDWYRWQEEAFIKARNENKLLIISIGYSACHWCHVMERECFEDHQVAQLMNAHYVSIKVDREEHTDVDQIYMDALQLMTGRGGWPLNIVALPDGRPVWGATYLPKKSWMSALEQIAGMYRENPAQLYEYADNLSRGVSLLHSTPEIRTFRRPDGAEVNKAAEKFLKNRDFQLGGPSRAPKFMMPVQLLDMLRCAVFTQNQPLSDYVHTTLRQMARSGIFDQTAGGFYRYSTDMEWKIPHFEKMLYDNAQLLELYAEAFKHTPEETYLTVIRRITDWLDSEMKCPEGGYYSALDADAEGEEGKTYTYTPDEILQMLIGLHEPFLRDVYALHPGEQWEGRYVLHQREPLDTYTARYGLDPQNACNMMDTFLHRANAVRQSKPRPCTDDKVIAAWNLMLVSALVSVFEATGQREWLSRAMELADCCQQILDHRAHYFKDGLYYSRSLLDDLAQAIRASIRLFCATGEALYLDRALNSLHQALDRHETDDQILFTNTPADDQLLFHKAVETEDNVIPSSNALMAENLFLTGHLTGLWELTERSLAMLNALLPRAEEYPEAYYHWWLVYQMHASNWKMYVITGPLAHSKALEYRKKFLCDGTVISSDRPSEADIFKNRFSPDTDYLYLCEGESCRAPEVL
ncbi:MAG: thioredoxin domain-containing protein [Thermaurantimonas sp.]